MVGFRREMPSVTALVTFEAAARLRNFTRAAAELGVTQAAVSRQIRALEADLGGPLFRRLHRRVELTDNGAALATTLTRCLGQMSDAVRTVRQAHGGDELIVSATVAFSHFWLIPRISDFRGANPGLKLRIIAQDAPVDLLNENIDVAIRYGDGSWRDGRAVLLSHETVFPVCSPDFLHRHGPIETPAELLRLPLVTSDVADPTWTGWPEWFAACGVEGPPGPIPLGFSHYTDAVSAAMNGQGVALGWARLLGEALRQRRLVRVTNASMQPPGGYFVVLPANRASKASAERFAAWARANWELAETIHAV